jgi:DNA polymerase-1
VEADYSQLELRVMAHMSQDREMLRAYREGLDIHQMTMDELMIEDRTPAKNCNFGLIYRLGAKGLQLTLWQKARLRYDIDTCFDWREGWLRKYSGVPIYHRGVEQFVAKNQFIRTLAGRYRRFKWFDDETYYRAISQAINTSIQGSAGDITLIAMRNFQRAVDAKFAQDRRWERVILLNQIHDALLVKTPKVIAEEVLLVLKDSMENAVKLTVPLVANIGIGRSWAAAEKDAKRREEAEQRRKSV